MIFQNIPFATIYMNSITYTTTDILIAVLQVAALPAVSFSALNLERL